MFRNSTQFDKYLIICSEKLEKQSLLRLADISARLLLQLNNPSVAFNLKSLAHIMTTARARRAICGQRSITYNGCIHGDVCCAEAINFA